jgi:Fe2+ transport system protein FeoA
MNGAETLSNNDSGPLSSLPTGERGILVAFTGSKGVWGKMASLGLTPGTEIAMAQNPRYGALIVLVRTVRIAIGRAEAQEIQMRRCA